MASIIIIPARSHCCQYGIYYNNSRQIAVYILRILFLWYVIIYLFGLVSNFQVGTLLIAVILELFRKTDYGLFTKIYHLFIEYPKASLWLSSLLLIQSLQKVWECSITCAQSVDGVTSKQLKNSSYTVPSEQTLNINIKIIIITFVFVVVLKCCFMCASFFFYNTIVL